MPSHGPPGDPHKLLSTNPWRSFIEDDPDIAYPALRPRSGSPSFLDYWMRRGGQVRQDYLGKLGQMALRGQAPNLEYTDYLSKYPFMREYSELGPQERGGDARRYAPSLRWRA